MRLLAALGMPLVVLSLALFLLLTPSAARASASAPARIVTEYALTSTPDYQAHDPTAWRLLGSNDGTNWTVLDVRTNEVFTARSTRRVFPVANKNPYNIYRLQIDDAAGLRYPGLAMSVQLAEVELIGRLVGVDNETNLQQIISASDPNPLMGPPENAFDGDPGSRWMDFGFAHSGSSWIQCQYALQSEILVANIREMQLQAHLAAMRGGFSEQGPEILSNLTAFADKPLRTLTGYALTSANDVPERDLRDWRLLGSSDGGKTWTLVDQRTNEIFSSRFKRRVFMLNRPANFSTYRIEVDSTAMPGNLVQLAEIEPLYPAGQTNTPVSLVVSAEAENPPTETAESAFDGDPKTKWLDFTITTPRNPCWIQWQYIPAEKDLSVINLRRLSFLAENSQRAASARMLSNVVAQMVMHPRVLTGYSLTAANDMPARDPRFWRLLASNDGGNSWVTLDARSNEVFTERSEQRTFSLKNDRPYSLYRLEIASVRGPDANSVQLAGLDPIFAPGDAAALSTVVSAQGENLPNEKTENLFDGKAESKWLDFGGDNDTNRSSWIQWYYAAGLPDAVVNLDELRENNFRPAIEHHLPRLKLQFSGVVVSLETNLIGLLDESGFQLLQLDSPIVGVRPGDRVRLSGLLRFDKQFPVITDPQVIQLGPLPVAEDLRIGQSTVARQGFVSGTTAGIAGLVSDDGVYSTIELSGDAGLGPLIAKIFNPHHAPLASIAGKRMRLQGVIEPVFKDNGQRMPGIVWASGTDAISSVEALATNAMPVPPAAQFDKEHPATNLRQVSQLINSGPTSPVPAKVRGIITYIDLNLGEFYLQSGTNSLMVWDQMSAGLSPFLHQEGDYVELEGVLEDYNFHPAAFATILGKGCMPEPLRHSWDYLMTGRDDGRWIELEGVVSAFEQHRLTLAVTGGQLIVWINEIDKNLQSQLLGSVVRIQGVCGPVYNSGSQRLGQRLLVPSSDYIQIVKAAPENPFDMPTTAVGSVMGYQTDNSEQVVQIVKTAGVVTYVGPGLLFIQDRTGGIRVIPRQEISVKPGDRVEAVGLAEPDGLSPKLDQALIRKKGIGKLPEATTVDLLGILYSDSGTNQDATRLRIDATLLGHSIRDSVEVYELQSDALKKTCYAFLPLGAGAIPVVPDGSRVRLEGVFKAEADTVADSGQVMTAFELYLNSQGDIVVLQRPPWWTARHTLWIFSGLGGVLLFSLVWAGSLRRQVHNRTHELRKEIEEHKRTEVHLQSEIAERKRMEKEVANTHKELMMASHQAGMAEVATSVLHNVGNVLNSVNVSATLVAELVRKSKSAGLARVTTLIREHSSDLAAFLKDDPKGRQLPDYLAQLAQYLAIEQSSVLKEMESLNKNIDHIKDIVAMQQSYAKVAGVTETVQVTDLVEDALRMNAGALQRHEVRIVREFDSHLPPVTVQKHKVLQILVNLMRNAKYACDESGRADKRLTIRVSNGGDFVRVIVSDNGIGIPAENLTKIFNHGFTTRKEGHGFGLHSGALAAKEMGGVLHAASEGLNRGATFTLELPLAEPEKN